MRLALTDALAARPLAVRRFLNAAVVRDVPTIDTMAEQGVPVDEAAEFLRRLELAGELTADGWSREARNSYHAVVHSHEGTTVLPLMARLPASERPREKALSSGIASLSDAELVALALRTGRGQEGVLELAARLLRQYDGLAGLARRSVDLLAGPDGLGPARAAELAASFEIGRRFCRTTLRDRPAVRTPQAVAELLAPLATSLAHEELWCLPLDSHSRVIGEPRVISRGDVDGTDAGPRAFFRIALAAGATSCIAVHNHPGGDPTPSGADRSATCRLYAAGQTLDVPLVDHVVLAAGGRWASIRELHPACFR